MLNLWYSSIRERKGIVFVDLNLRKRQYNGVAKVRAEKRDLAIQEAAKNLLPIRVVVNDGRMRKATDPEPKASQVDHRLLDPVPWAVTSYNWKTGKCSLTRGVFAGGIVDQFSGEQEAAEFPEGRTAYVLHRKRERSALLTKKVKSLALKNHGHLYCKVCGFDFQNIYGQIGEGFIEAHHTIPVSRLHEKSITRIEDIVLVCSNCHRMLHRRRPWLTLHHLSKLIIRQKSA